MQQKPKLSFWQIWNMSFGFLGIQFGYALQGGFMSRIFETLGADDSRRTNDGIPEVISMSYDLFVKLLEK